MVSQFEVAEEYTQINYKGRPVRVTPLRYGGLDQVVQQPL